MPAIWGRNRSHAERLAQAHGIPRVYDTLDELLADPEVAVVDIAVVPEAQVEIALRALDAGKDVMCQKPLALDVADAASASWSGPTSAVARSRSSSRCATRKACSRRAP